MAYDKNKLTKLGALEELAERVKTKFATKTEVSNLESRIDDITAQGGEPNTINKIKVNGTEQAITNKAVDITVPTKVSDLTNDRNFQTDTQVAGAISSLRTELMGEGVPEAYDTFKELADYIEEHETASEALIAAIGNKVDKVSGKGLSTNDYTTEEKTKLDGIEAGANNYVHPGHTAKTSGLYKVTVDELGHVSATAAVEKADITKLGIPAQDTTYGEATGSSAGLMPATDKTKLDGIEYATDAEVTEMLNSVFGA